MWRRRLAVGTLIVALAGVGAVALGQTTEWQDLASGEPDRAGRQLQRLAEETGLAPGAVQRLRDEGASWGAIRRAARISQQREIPLDEALAVSAALRAGFEAGTAASRSGVRPSVPPEQPERNDLFRQSRVLRISEATGVPAEDIWAARADGIPWERIRRAAAHAAERDVSLEEALNHTEPDTNTSTTASSGGG